MLIVCLQFLQVSAVSLSKETLHWTTPHQIGLQGTVWTQINTNYVNVTPCPGAEGLVCFLIIESEGSRFSKAYLNGIVVLRMKIK